MANLIYACWRGDDSEGLGGRLPRVAARITPAGLAGQEPRVVHGPGECLCLTGPNRAVAVAGCSARLGLFTGPAPDWQRPGTPVPDGSYALVRSDPGTAEAWRDEAGTRTLWYLFDARRLLVSTSQRALVCLLGDLDWNPAAFAWYLAGGNLGPAEAWDRRIRRLPQAGHLVLDRRTWTLDLHVQPVRFATRAMSEAEAVEGLRDTLMAVLGSLSDLPPSWILPLSGGYDSRFLLAALCRHGFRPRTVTWGLAASRTQPGNDACLAEQVARHFGARNDYLLTEASEASPRELADTFLAAHGGTTDALFPYLDGLRLWTGFAREGVDGILRGDEGFGTRPRPEVHTRFARSLVPLGEILAPDDAEAIAGGHQALPETFLREPGESPQAYGDRLLHTFNIPVLLAGLNDVKAPFLEIASPMLAGSVLAFARQVPEHLRANRGYYKKMVRSLTPPVPIATLAADDSRNRFLREPRFRAWVAEELEGDFCQRALPERLRLSWRASALRGTGSLLHSPSLRAALKRLLPASWIRNLKRVLPPDRPPGPGPGAPVRPGQPAGAPAPGRRRPPGPGRRRDVQSSGGPLTACWSAWCFGSAHRPHPGPGPGPGEPMLQITGMTVPSGHNLYVSLEPSVPVPCQFHLDHVPPPRGSMCWISSGWRPCC